jgi:hypothetical protein
VLCFLPESPRWLAYNGQQEKALNVLARINGTTIEDEDVQLQHQEIVSTLTSEKEVGEKVGFADLMKTKVNRKRLFLALSVAPLSMITGEIPKTRLTRRKDLLTSAI